MASNADLIEDILALDADAVTDDLTNKELAALLKEMKAEPVTKTYKLADGKAVTTMRGIMSDGVEVSAADLSGGQAALESLAAAGYLVGV